MPEYLAPGVYVEETSYRTKSIEGVGTSTAGFIGPTRFGPLRGTPEVMTTFADFQRIYGGLEMLQMGDSKDTAASSHNYMAHAMRAFFNEGGSRVYVSRVFTPRDATNAKDGYAYLNLGVADPKDATKIVENTLLAMSARYPGAMGNMRLTFALRCGQNILGTEKVAGADKNVLRGVSNYDLVWVIPKDQAAPKGDDSDYTALIGNLYWVEKVMDGQRVTYNLNQAAGGTTKALDDPSLAGAEVRVLTLNAALAFNLGGGRFGTDQLYTGFSLHAAHPNAISAFFAEKPATKAAELYIPLVIQPVADPYTVLTQTLLIQKDASSQPIWKHMVDMAKDTKTMGEDVGAFQVIMDFGHDGKLPDPADYDGDEGADYLGRKSGLFALGDLDDIAIVAAPGSSFDTGDGLLRAETIAKSLLTHCEQHRYRVAIIDAPNAQIIGQVRAYRSKFDSTFGAMYYPWIKIMDPVTQAQIDLPPSGFVAGIWARTDQVTGVHKAPANEVVRMATGLEIFLNKGQQDVLNPEGINCFRFFEGRGIRLWGARTMTSDSEWKYINLRRYFAYLEHSIDKATQWVVFEPNGPTLWDKVRSSVEDFLFAEWKKDRLLGSAPAEAYFVRCDRSTMVQNDLDNGRLIVQVGVAPLRPAEFVIFQIGQWTASK